MMLSHRAIGRPGTLLLARSRALQPFLPPETMQALVVHQPALSPQQAVGHPPVPTNVLSLDLPEAMPELGLLDVDDLAAMALGAAMLAHHPTGDPLGNPELARQQKILYHSVTRSIQDRIVSWLSLTSGQLFVARPGIMFNSEPGSRSRSAATDLNSWIVSAGIPTIKEKT